MKIHYIVSVYIGKRLTQSVNRLIEKDPYHFIKKHLECLSKFKVPDISKVTFVISKNDAEIDEHAKDVLQEYDLDIPVEFILRENLGMSYAGWNEVIHKSLENGDDYDYFFLIEDDYVPHIDYFYNYFVEAANERTFFVAQKYMNFSENAHPAVSNGLVSYRLAKDVKAKMGSVFKVDVSTGDYWLGVQNQIHYLKNAQSMGYEFHDVESTTIVPFLDRTKYSFYGNIKNPIVLIPECDLDWRSSYRDQLYGFKFRKASEILEDEEKNGVPADERLSGIYGRMRKIRSLYNHNKDTSNFSNEESNKFYFENRDNIYVIFEDDCIELAGYCHIKKKDDLIFVSPKLMFHYIRGDMQYVTKFAIFLSWFCEENNIKEIYCEALKENNKLISQLARSGFSIGTETGNTQIYKYVQP